MAADLENEAEFIQLSDSCNFLEHYHQEHTDDKITRFRGKGPQPVLIYVVSDPEWVAKFAELVKEEFPERPADGRKFHRRRR